MTLPVVGSRWVNFPLLSVSQTFRLSAAINNAGWGIGERRERRGGEVGVGGQKKTLLSQRLHSDWTTDRKKLIAKRNGLNRKKERYMFEDKSVR